MAIASHLHQLFNTETCQAYIQALRWKDRPLQCPRCQRHHVGPWGTYHYQPGLHVTAVKRRPASALAMTARVPSWTAVRAPSPTGFSPLFCSVWRVRPGAWPERWGAIAGRALAGAGGCAMRHYAMRCSVSWRAPWKRMSSLTPRVSKAKRNKGGRHHWDAAHVVAASSASRAGGIRTKTGRLFSPGAAARGLSCDRRPKSLRWRRGNGQPISRCKWAVGSPRTRPAAIGRCRAIGTSASIIRGRNTRVVRSQN
jgi:hypothetical protein